ncbi:MAG TPA: ABC transporter ATP-binding protein [Stellaceae bacterium]|nr:ABC transporter ATP-binding protein [Stellaceae bacterium]
MTSPPALLEVEELSVGYATARGRLAAVDRVSFTIGAGRALGLVGESGSGKSTIVLALLGLLESVASVTAKAMRFKGAELLRTGAITPGGDRIGVVLQDASAALNPALTVGLQIAEPLIVHRRLSRRAAIGRAVELLGEVGVRRPAEIARCYPHQLSGGMKQRALIAMALSCEPDVLLLDEPTTALDVTIEAQILDLFEALRLRRGLSFLFVSHNLAIIEHLCDDLAVLYAGRVVEHGPTELIFRQPRHPYTKGLLAALPRIDRDRIARLAPIPGELPDLTRPLPGCNFQPRCPFSVSACAEVQLLSAQPDTVLVRCQRAKELEHQPWPADERQAPPTRATPDRPLIEADHLSKSFRLGGLTSRIELTHGLPRLKPVSEQHAVDDVSLVIRPGEILGVVGESGSGKTTLARLLLRLVEADHGALRFNAEPVPRIPPREFRRRTQIVFQNPESSLNPRKRVGEILARPLALFGTSGDEAVARSIDRLLTLVRLSPSYRDRYPHQLSGGEKQRVSIARAMASRPDILICDEAVSALDVSVQAAILNLFADLRDHLGVAYLFISHDISVIAHLADRVAVMYGGALVEEGPLDRILQPPYHPYTEALLSAAPIIGVHDRARARIRLPPERVVLGKGCRFASRCPRRIGNICDDVPPPTREPAPNHRIACHIPTAELAAMDPVLVRSADMSRRPG